MMEHTLGFELEKVGIFLFIDSCSNGGMDTMKMTLVENVVFQRFYSPIETMLGLGLQLFLEEYNWQISDLWSFVFRGRI